MEREEAIKIIRDARCTSPLRDAIESLVPELAESEDERIRKAIYGIIFCTAPELVSLHGITKDKAFAYLEKQKECVADAGKTSENTSASTMIPSCWEEPLTEKQKEYNARKFRAEAAAKFLQAAIVREGPNYLCAQRNVPEQASEAIMYADELIRQLKDEQA